MNATILHGTGCNPHSFWQPSIKKYLETKGYEVWIPQLPDARCYVAGMQDRKVRRKMLS